MMDSKAIAGVMGPALIAITLSEAPNLRIWTSAAPSLIYLNGTLLFVAGVAVVRAHNIWIWKWPVVVTVLGWLAMLAGLYRLFLPNAPQGGENAATYAVITGLFAAGCFLSAQAYLTKPRSAES